MAVLASDGSVAAVTSFTTTSGYWAITNDGPTAARPQKPNIQMLGDTENAPVWTGAFPLLNYRRTEGADVLRLGTLRSLGDVEFNLLVLVE